MKKKKKLKNKLFIILATIVCFSVVSMPMIRPKAYIVDEHPVEGIFSLEEVFINGQDSFVYYDLSNQMPFYLDIDDTLPGVYTIEYENYPSANPVPPLLASLHFTSAQWTDFDYEFINENYPYTLTQYESLLWVSPYSSANDIMSVHIRYNDFIFMPVVNYRGDTALEFCWFEFFDPNVDGIDMQVSFYGTMHYTNSDGQKVTMDIEDAIKITSQDEYVYFDYYPSNALVLDGYPSPVLFSDFEVHFSYVLSAMNTFEVYLMSYTYTNFEGSIYHNQDFLTVYNLPDYVTLYDSNTYITPGIGDLLLSISQAVVNFLKVEIFPGFAFYYILIIALAIPLLVAILKLYLGG